MKRIILILIVFFNLLPCIKQGEIKWMGEVEIMAQPETPGGSENETWACSASLDAQSENECTFTVSCSCTKNGVVIKTATYGMSYSNVHGYHTDSFSPPDAPSSPPASYESPCSSDTSTKSGTPSNNPPDTSGGKKTGGGDVTDPPLDPPLTPTIGSGGGGGTPSMVTCPSVTLSSTLPTSATATDGTITPTVSGGSGDYDISISSGPPLADGKFSGLGQGSFEVTVTDKQYSCQDVKASTDLTLPCPSTKTKDTVNIKSSTCPSDTSSSVYEVTKDCNGNQIGRKFLSVKCKCPDDDNFQVTAAMLKEIDPNGTGAQRDDAAKYINQFKDDPDFQLDTRLRLAHFLAQIMAETDGFRVMAEGYGYTKKTLLKMKKIFDSSNVDQYVDCLCVFDRLYCCNRGGLGNGDEASKEGSLYRGQGVTQLTGKDNYTRFNKFYKKKFNDNSINFVNTPDLLATNMQYAILSGLWDFCIHSKCNKYADNDDCLSIGQAINCGPGDVGTDAVPKNESGREKNLKAAKKLLCLQ